jgi:hypothetical protein
MSEAVDVEILAVEMTAAPGKTAWFATRRDA